jgi:hypothetical protein
MIVFGIKLSAPINMSALADFSQQLNKQAAIREYFLTIAANLSFMDANAIKLQASTLVKLTEATSQLTRVSCVSISFFFISCL